MNLFRISVVKGKKRLSFFIQARSTAEAMKFAKLIFSKCDSRTVTPIENKIRTIWA